MNKGIYVRNTRMNRNMIHKKEKMIEIRVNRRLLEDFIIKAIYYIVNGITFAAVMFLTHALASMVENWSVSGTPVTIAIISSAWLGIVGLIAYVINKLN